MENEHIKNLQSDGWRAAQLRKSLSNPKHPNHKFGTGNLQSLCNRCVRPRIPRSSRGISVLPAQLDSRQPGRSTSAGTVANKCAGTLNALKKFYKMHYIASRMRLCVVAKEGIDALEELVRG